MKFDWLKEYGTITASPPSRAAWIEMLNFAIMLSTRVGRRLHGRRGLKFAQLAGVKFEAVAAFTGGVD